MFADEEEEGNEQGEKTGYNSASEGKLEKGRQMGKGLQGTEERKRDGRGRVRPGGTWEGEERTREEERWNETTGRREERRGPARRENEGEKREEGERISDENARGLRNRGWREKEQRLMKERSGTAWEHPKGILGEKDATTVWTRGERGQKAEERGDRTICRD